MIREPVEVVAVVVTESRVGFAYGTLSGHQLFPARKRSSCTATTRDACG